MRKWLVALIAALAVTVPAATAQAGLTGGITSGGKTISGGSLPGGICSPCPGPAPTKPVIVGGGIVTLPPPQAVASKKARDRCKRKRAPRVCRYGLQVGVAPNTWLAVAAAYWGVTATCPPTTVHLIWDQALLDNTPYGRVFGMANINACWTPGAERNIWLNPYYLTVQQTPGFTPSFWCHVVTHEYGHLIGLYHSDDPNSVMSRNLPNVPVPGC